MRLQELFETTQEDKELITLSSSIYAKLTPYIDLGSNDLVSLGKIKDIVDSPLGVLSNVSIEILGGDKFIERAKDPEESVADFSGLEFYGFYEEYTRTVVLNADLLGKHRMKTSITHELRHALDEIKSGSFPGDANRYFTPKKKEHRKSDPYSTIQYRAQPAEINARFTEVLDILSKRIPKWYNSIIKPENIKAQLTTDFKNLLQKYEIADLFPEKTKSKDYKRLVKRAYAFMQAEIDDIESSTGKKSTGSW